MATLTFPIPQGYVAPNDYVWPDGFTADDYRVSHPSPRPFSESYEPRVIKVEFGDGYQQRATDGINPILREWRVGWVVTPSRETQIILNFLKARNAIEAFYWHAPTVNVTGTSSLAFVAGNESLIKTEKIKIVCPKWSIQFEDDIGEHKQLRVEFMEVIE